MKNEDNNAVVTTTNLNISSDDLIKIFRDTKEELIKGFGINVGDLQVLDMLIEKTIDHAKDWKGENQHKL